MRAFTGLFLGANLVMKLMIMYLHVSEIENDTTMNEIRGIDFESSHLRMCSDSSEIDSKAISSI